MPSLRINLFPGIDVKPVEARIAALGGTIEERHDTDLRTTLKVTVPANEIFPLDAHAGIAPEANLVFQALEDNDTGETTGIPADLTELFAEAETEGADLHTNSWGGKTASMYTASAQDVDEYMWNHPDFLILFAAGNQVVQPRAVHHRYNPGNSGFTRAEQHRRLGAAKPE